MISIITKFIMLDAIFLREQVMMDQTGVQNFYIKFFIHFCVQVGCEETRIPPNMSQSEEKKAAISEHVSLPTAENQELCQEATFAQNAAISLLQAENQKLRTQLQSMENMVEKIFSKDQVRMLQGQNISHWSNEDVIKALKFRYALSVKGFEYLRNTGYPLPSYSTLMRRIQSLNIQFGIFHDVLDLLRLKASIMEPSDKFCVLSCDEFLINEQLDYDKSSGVFIGYVSLGDDESLVGQKMLLVVVRGVKNRWKQIIGCHVTRKERMEPELFSNFLLQCIDELEKCGLRVIVFSSDLDGRNKSFLNSMNISASQMGKCINSFSFNKRDIFVIPDICHLLKNLKSSVLSQPVFLPSDYVEKHNLGDFNVVRGSYVIELWNHEVSNNMEKRLLHHLRREDVYPSNFDKMNVGAAVRFFSPKTASALQTATKMGILPPGAVATAQFILTMYEWFTIVSSQLRKTSITARNCDVKYIFLNSIIDLFKNIVFTKGWKPLNYGIVIATTSFCDVAEFLFHSEFEFVLGHRFTQDATENIISQIRNKEGKMPSALKAMRAIKSISVSQFVSKVKNSCYLSESDEFLLDFCKNKKKTNVYETIPSNINDVLNFDIQTFSISDFAETIDTYDTNSIFYVAGSTTLAVGKKVCSDCVAFLYEDNLPNIEFVQKAKTFTDVANKGGLKYPCFETFLLVLHCEMYYTAFREYLHKNSNVYLIKSIIEFIEIDFPTCCSIKEKIVYHYFNVSSFCTTSFTANLVL